MAKIQISCDYAERRGSSIAVKYHLTGKPPAVPCVTVETNRLDEVLQARAAFMEVARATGLPLVVSMRVVTGRAPNGFKAEVARQYHVPINL